MNDIKEGDIIVIVVDIPEYCKKGTLGILHKYDKYSEYPYRVIINKQSYNFIRDEIEKVGGLIV